MANNRLTPEQTKLVTRLVLYQRAYCEALEPESELNWRVWLQMTNEVRAELGMDAIPCVAAA